jgi:hypothetical protein
VANRGEEAALQAADLDHRDDVEKRDSERHLNSKGTSNNGESPIHDAASNGNQATGEQTV